MRQLAVISGKGGTGKTMLTTALALCAENVVMADCDVEAPNLHLMLDAQPVDEEPFYGLDVAVIEDTCTQCGACADACRFGAITDAFSVEPLRCEGCGVCALVCPSDAIHLERRMSGTVVVSNTQWGRLVYAMLKPGQSASGRLVATVRKRALEMADGGTVLIDGPPGSSCPTISTLTGVQLALVVCEPTLSALSDMRRVLALADQLHVKGAVCINKCGLNDAIESEIEAFCMERGVDVVGRMPYKKSLFEAYARGHCVDAIQTHPILEQAKDIWRYFERTLREVMI